MNGRRLDWSLALAVAAAVAASVLAIVSLARDGLSPQSDSSGSAMARLVPANVLAYAHVALDRGRDPVEQLAAQAEQFPSYKSLRTKLVRKLASPDCDRATSALKDADDASLSLFETSKGAAVSLLLIDQGGERDSPDTRRCGVLLASNIGPYLAIGQRQALTAAAALYGRDGKGSLARDPLAEAEFARLPKARAVDGWLSVDGVRRLLIPQKGILGLAATTVDQPRLRGMAFGLAPTDAGVTLALRRALSLGARPKPTSQRQHDAVVERIPSGVLAAFVTPRLGGSLNRLSGGAGAAVGGGLLAALPADVVKLFDRPTAVILTAVKPAPVMTILTTTDDESAARRTLAAMPAKAKALFTGRVAGGYVALATRRIGLATVAAPKSRLVDSSEWQQTVGEKDSEPSGSLLFLDFSKLLELAEQTGLGSDPAYRTIRSDLGRIQAAGATIDSGSRQSTADLTLLIP